MGERHDELRHAGGEGLRSGADAAVMDQCGALWEQLAERGVVEMLYAGGKRGRNLSAMARQENPAAAKALA